MRFKKGLKVWKLKKFEDELAKYGFYYDHCNSAHNIYADSDGYYVTIPKAGKEINAMMTTVNLQRIKNKTCRKLW